MSTCLYLNNVSRISRIGSPPMILNLACDTIFIIHRKFFIDILSASAYSILPSIAGGLGSSLISFPDIGPVCSAGIMAKIGDIIRFDNQETLGFVWKHHQSGDFKAKFTRLIPSDNQFLKYYLCETAFSLVKCDKEYSDFYHLKHKKVNRYQHKRALTLTAVNLCF